MVSMVAVSFTFTFLYAAVVVANWPTAICGHRYLGSAAFDLFSRTLLRAVGLIAAGDEVGDCHAEA